MGFTPGSVGNFSRSPTAPAAPKRASTTTPPPGGEPIATCPAKQTDPVAHPGKPHPGLGFALQSATVVADPNHESP